MHRCAPRRRSAPIAGATPVTLRLLWHTLEIGGDTDVLDMLVPLLAQAAHPMPARAAMRYEAVAARRGTGVEVREEGDLLTLAPTTRAASDAIYVRAHRRAFELASLAGWVRVHAATVDLDGARVLLVGPSGVGKTTLALRMLFDGVAVQGDESVLLRAGDSLAVPRAFHVKDGTDAHVPELRELDDLLRVEDVRVLDPNRVSESWALQVRPVDVVVVVERAGPNEPGNRPASGAEVLEALLSHTFPLTESKADLLRTLAGATAGALGCHLTVGDPETTVGALRSLVRYSAVIRPPWIGPDPAGEP